MNGQVEGQLTLFPEDSPASRLVLPGSSEARKMTATSGQKWLGLSKNSGPLGLLEKMLLESLEWHSPKYFLNWKPVDIGQGYFLFQLARSEPDMCDTGWRLWATPKASIRGDCPSERKRKSPDLAAAVKMWPTPTAQDGQNSTFPKSQINRGSLVGDVMKEMAAVYPTPTTGAGLCGGTGNYQKLKKLEEQGTISEEERKSMSQGNGGQLNPYWVEWLMGFPPGWTETF